MKTNFKKASRWAIALIIMQFFSLITTDSQYVWADSAFKFAITPMYEKIILNPGDTFTGSFDVINKTNSNSAISYEAEANCYFVDENYNNVYGEESSWCQIKDWISIKSGGKGVLEAGGKEQIVYTISVPRDAAGGGQYATIMVTADSADANIETNAEQNDSVGIGTGIKERKTIAYLIYAEITGDVIKQGEVLDTTVPSFLLSGNITGASSIKNTGNVHGTAKYTLQVFPLFSDEEVFTNEENPDTRAILPERTLYNEISWANTPAFGIFNVVYTVEFEGVTEQVSKMVIKCPIWLLFIIIFAIAAIIIYFIMRAKSRKNSRKRIETQ